MNLPSNFMEKAKGMTRNPLGIIGLFISLVYGIACAVLGFGIDHFKNECERLPLIWFIIVFPICILAAFVYLVIKHHWKLYAPGDYKDEGNFIQTLNSKHQKLRIQKEVEDIREDISTNAAGVTIVDHDTVNTENINRLTDKYLIAEDLSLRAFEQGKTLTIKRHSGISGKDGPGSAFDAIAFDLQSVYCIDIRFTIHGHLSKVLKDKIVASFRLYNRNVKDLNFLGEAKLLLIVVSDSKSITTLPKDLEQLAASARFPMQTIVYSFHELKERFGYDEKGN